MSSQYYNRIELVTRFEPPTCSLAMKFYRQPEMYAKFLDVLNVIFTVFFTMEFVFKLGAFRFKVTISEKNSIFIAPITQLSSL